MHKQGSIRSLIVLLTRLQMMRDGTGRVNDGRDTTAVAYLIINDKPPPPSSVQEAKDEEQEYII